MEYTVEHALMVKIFMLPITQMEMNLSVLAAKRQKHLREKTSRSLGGIINYYGLE
jgi:hypothetical protein